MAKAKETIIIPSTSADLKKIKDAAAEASNSYTIIEGARGHIKDCVDALHEDTNLPKRAIRRMFKEYYKDQLRESHDDDNDYHELVQAVFG